MFSPKKLFFHFLGVKKLFLIFFIKWYYATFLFQKKISKRNVDPDIMKSLICDVFMLYRVSHIEMYKVNWLRIDNFMDIVCSINAWGYDILIFVTSFQKRNIGWPQQPLKEKVLKFNVILHDSTKTKIDSKHQNKA